MSWLFWLTPPGPLFVAVGFRRKSVENLLVSSHDVIGSSISSSITLGTMTLPTNCPGFYVSSPDSLEQRLNVVPKRTGLKTADVVDWSFGSRSHSPSASPQSSPRQHHRREHSRSNYSSSGSFKDASPSLLDKPDAVEVRDAGPRHRAEDGGKLGFGQTRNT
uniref:Uncharacterized protein n=1 Tax=Timema shepardi TaxID=629360 RepID=A0A7R9BA21_TIMSH|nr:unnamed protein product [Timema shepardi]